MYERIVQVNRNNRWADVRFKDLHTGDNFRMFESNGDPVIGVNNESTFHATSMPYYDEEIEAHVIEVCENMKQSNKVKF